MKQNYLLTGLFCLFCHLTLFSQSAQWRGPERNGIFPETDLLETWPEAGPDKLFVTEGLGMTYASTIATETHIYTTGNIDTTEFVSCIDMSGSIVWQKPYGPCWTNSFPQARCTPTLDGNRIYVISGLDMMACFDASSGDELWRVDIHATYKSELDRFGVSESPLIVDDKIIVSPAGGETTIIALDKMSGELIWKSETLNDKRSYVSPRLIDFGGEQLIVAASSLHVLCLDPKDGSIRWNYQYSYLTEKGENPGIIANTPLYSDSCVWISNGWDLKSVMLQIADDGRSVSEKFVDHTFDNQNHGDVLIDGYVYGSNFTGRKTGKWVCMNWKSGEIVWLHEFETKGPIVSADGMLYLYDERRGNIALVKPSPKKFDMVSTFKIQDGKGPHWSRPSIYNKMLLIRHGDVLVAYDIAAKS